MIDRVVFRVKCIKCNKCNKCVKCVKCVNFVKCVNSVNCVNFVKCVKCVKCANCKPPTARALTGVAGSRVVACSCAERERRSPPSRRAAPRQAEGRAVTSQDGGLTVRVTDMLYHCYPACLLRMFTVESRLLAIQLYSPVPPRPFRNETQPSARQSSSTCLTCERLQSPPSTLMFRTTNQPVSSPFLSLLILPSIPLTQLSIVIPTYNDARTTATVYNIDSMFGLGLL